jgi:hypothetical protein
MVEELVVLFGILLAVMEAVDLEFLEAVELLMVALEGAECLLLVEVLHIEAVLEESEAMLMVLLVVQ